MIVNFRGNAQNPGFKIVQLNFHTEVDPRHKHEAQPIKKLEDIQTISNYLVANERYRDNLLFIAGINLGFRCSDLLKLQIGHMIDSNGWIRETIVLQENKTDKYREVYINNAVADAVNLYLKGKQVDLDDYLFPSYSNNNRDVYYEEIQKMERWSEKRRAESETYVIRYGTDGPISRRSVDRMLKKLIVEDCGINIRVGTHTLRKTFGYHALMSAPDRNRALELVQKMLNHSSPQITMRYIGITDDEIQGMYTGLNLGQYAPVMDVRATLGMKTPEVHSA